MFVCVCMYYSKYSSTYRSVTKIDGHIYQPPPPHFSVRTRLPEAKWEKCSLCCLVSVTRSVTHSYVSSYHLPRDEEGSCALIVTLNWPQWLRRYSNSVANISAIIIYIIAAITMCALCLQLSVYARIVKYSSAVASAARTTGNAIAYGEIQEVKEIMVE